MGLIGLYMGKVTLMRKKLVASSVFLKWVRPLVCSDPASAENRVDATVLLINKSIDLSQSRSST